MIIRFFTTALVLAHAAGCATAPQTPRATASAKVSPVVTAPAEQAATPPAVESVAPVGAAAAVTASVTPSTPAPVPKPAVATAPVTPKPVPEAPSKAPAPAEKPPAPGTNTIKGRLDLLAGPRQSVAAGEISEGLVYFLPDGGAPLPKPGRFTVSTHSKGFTPNHLVVPVGSTVSFPNRDTILHNVYSRTPGSTFDLGTYGPGDTRQAVLKNAGLVIVNCNVHPSMRTNVVVLATPYHARPGRDGSFQIKDIPVGPGTLVFWHPRANAGTLPITSGRSTPVVQRLMATKARLEAHSTGGN